MLEPDQRHVGGMLGLLDLVAPRRLEMRKRLGDIAPSGRAECLVERDRILHRQLGAGPDGEMRRRLGIADQHHVAGDPAFAADVGEIAPDRPVGDDAMAGELIGEQALDETRRGRLVELVQAGAREGLRIGLDDPGRALRLVLIAVRDEDAVLRLAEEEREGVERPRRAHPGKQVGAQIHARLERGGECLAHARIDAVGGNDEIGIEQRRFERRDLGLVFDLHAERARPPAQDLQQRRTRTSAKAVAADAMGGAAEMDLDVVPIGEMADDGAVALAVVALEGGERLVGEHHAEAEGVVRPIALEYRDLRLRPCLLHQAREIEAGRTAADDVNFHAHLPLPQQPRAIRRRGAWPLACSTPHRTQIYFRLKISHRQA